MPVVVFVDVGELEMLMLVAAGWMTRWMLVVMKIRCEVACMLGRCKTGRRNPYRGGEFQVLMVTKTSFCSKYPEMLDGRRWVVEGKSSHGG
jgi:hypothetical protein